MCIGPFNERFNRLSDKVGTLAINFQKDFKPGLSFRQRQQHGIILVFCADYGVDFPVTECIPVFHLCRTLSDGWA